MTEQRVKQQHVKLKKKKKKKLGQIRESKAFRHGTASWGDCEPHIRPSSLFRHNFLIMAQSSGV